MNALFDQALIEARRPDIVVVNKQAKKCTIIDIAVPEDKKIGEKENDKIEKYQDWYFPAFDLIISRKICSHRYLMFV